MRNKKQILKYLNRENQYYPTPKELIINILNNMDISNLFYEQELKEVHFLEPCAGDGEICRTVKEHFERELKDKIELKIKCIEIEPTLSNSLKGQGFNVISDDFLEYQGQPFYDLIIMNPPFSKGARFLLKAYDLLTSGGQLVCILNAETVKNPCTKERALLKNLIERAGDYKILENAFQTENTERKANVEIAIVYLTKPVYENEFDMFGKVHSNVLTEEEKVIDSLKQKLEQESKNNNSIMTFDKIENSITMYRKLCKADFHRHRYYTADKDCSIIPKQ